MSKDIILLLYFFRVLERTLNFQCPEKKKESHRSSGSEVIDSEIGAYLTR